MRKRGHIVFAFILNIIFISTSLYLGFSFIDFDIKNIFLLSFIISFYSILPDIDHRASYITHIFFGIGILGLIIGILTFYFNFKEISPLLIIILSTLFLMFTYFSSNFAKHRGFIHSIPIGILGIIPIYFLFNNLYICVTGFIAWYSHLLGDGYWFKIK
jgi:hypothetical protein